MDSDRVIEKSRSPDRPDGRSSRSASEPDVVIIRDVREPGLGYRVVAGVVDLFAPSLDPADYDEYDRRIL